jgi:hypothetical protein
MFTMRGLFVFILSLTIRLAIIINMRALEERNKYIATKTTTTTKMREKEKKIRTVIEFYTEI